MLFGRGDEQATLRALLDTARRGRSSTLLLLGEPGAGKSSLLQELLEPPEPVLSLTARAVETESELPFATLDQLLRPVLSDLELLPPSQRAALKGALGLAEGEPADPYGVALAVLTLLGEVSEQQPVVCVIDDAQWMDGASRQTLLFVARRLLAEAVVVVFAAREGEFHGGGLRELHLEPLDVDATAKILADRARIPVSDDVAQRVRAATGGNALATVEVAGLLTPEQLAGRQPLPVPLPMSSGVERLFASRVNGLPPETRRLLLVAAVDDSERPDVVFTAAQRLSIGISALDAAEEAGLIRVDRSEVRFRHPLVRSAVYGTAVLSERQMVHRVLAAVFKQSGEIDRYAWHLASATLEPDPGVVRELEQAAERARGRNAYTASAAAFERAAELSPSSDERGRLLAEAATDAWLTGLLPQAERLVQAAEALVDDPLLLANCYRLRAAGELTAGTASTAVRGLLDAARHTALVDPRRALELLALATEGAWLALDSDSAREIKDLAGRLQVRMGDRDRFFADLLIGFSEQFSGDKDAATDSIRQAITVAQDEYDDVDLLLAAGRAAFYIGDDDAAQRFHERIVRRARSIGSIGCLAIGGTRLALAEILTGKWASGAAIAEETSRLAEDTGQDELMAHALAWLALLAAWRGDEGASREFLSRTRVITATHRMPMVEDATRWADGVLDLVAGRGSRAFEVVAAITHPVVAIAASLDRIESAVQAGNHERAALWLDQLESFALASKVPWALARVAHGRALIAEDPDVAEGYFEESLSHHAEADRPFERARTQLAYGAALRRRRRRLDARENLRSALETFERLRAEPWAERARTELRASGETARLRNPSQLERLTSQELQVVKLVRQGMSNKEVAAQLFVSPRTVDFHLRNVFAKLGISSRSQLIAAGAEN